MSTVSTSVEKLLTAEEYAALPNDGRVTELVMGRIVELNRPESNHGLYCGNINRVLGNFVHQHRLGRVICNDPGVVTRRGPDTVRGGDVLFYSYARVPAGPTPAGYWPAPELIFEVRSPSDRWVKIAKVQEYLEANVRLVVICDSSSSSIRKNNALMHMRQTLHPKLSNSANTSNSTNCFPTFYLAAACSSTSSLNNRTKR